MLPAKILGPTTLRIDLIPQPGVKILDAAHGTDGGNSAHQLCLGVGGTEVHSNFPHQAIAGDQFHQLFRVRLLLRRLAAARNMDMEVDQAGHEVAAP